MAPVKPESNPRATEPAGGPQRFVTTHWSVVLAASRPGALGHGEALDSLCCSYWYPVYAFIRRRGRTASDAEDLTQEFFARLLAKEWLAGIEAEGSRFRSFLLTAVCRFLANEYDRATAAKRGGGSAPLDLDQAEEQFLADTPGADTAERHYDRNWAVLILDQALGKLGEESRANGHPELFEALSPFLSREPVPGEYESLSTPLRLTANALGVAVHRLRRRYRETVRSLIADTVANPGDVDAELRHLVEVLRL